MIWIIGHILAACIGLSLGLIGGGGSVLALPILVYVMGYLPKSANLVGFLCRRRKCRGIIPHWRQGNVNLKKAFIFGSATMLGAFLGAKIASLPFISGTFQLLLFAVMMIVAAGFMIAKSRKSPAKIQADDLAFTRNQLVNIVGCGC